VSLWRGTGIAFAGAALAAVVLDPYTWHLTASDMVWPAPWWRTTLQLADGSLLVLAALLLWRRPRRASAVASTELLFALALGVLFVQRDGVHRFSRGFGGEESLSYYLVALACRAALVGAAGRAALGAPEGAT